MEVTGFNHVELLILNSWTRVSEFTSHSSQFQWVPIMSPILSWQFSIKYGLDKAIDPLSTRHWLTLALSVGTSLSNLPSRFPGKFQTARDVRPVHVLTHSYYANSRYKHSMIWYCNKVWLLPPIPSMFAIVSTSSILKFLNPFMMKFHDYWIYRYSIYVSWIYTDARIYYSKYIIYQVVEKVFLQICFLISFYQNHPKSWKIIIVLTSSIFSICFTFWGF